MHKEHVSIDLETFGTEPGSVIISIGAVRFTSKELLDTFKINIDPISAKQVGLKINKDTIEWWAKQSKEAKQGWQKDPVNITEALTKFVEWYGTKSIHPWGWSANFDIVLLESALAAVGLEEPWKYWEIMCGRTLSTLVGEKIDRVEGTHHDALDDAINQAKFIQKYLG